MQRLGRERKSLLVPTRTDIKPGKITIYVGTDSEASMKFLDSNIFKTPLFHISRNPKKQF